MELSDDKDFGARLREERERLGLLVHELAHLCGRLDGTQKKYETGTLSIPIDYLHARTDVDVMYVVTGRRLDGVAPS